MAKREPHWVKLFLSELERTGNVRMAAERAGVDFTTAYGRRKRHAEFAERWALRLRASRSAQDKREIDEAAPFAIRHAQGERSPSPGAVSAAPSSPSRGEELVARKQFDGVRLERIGPGRWSKKSEERFLAALAETANVRRAAEASGVSTTAVYARRLKSTSFAEAWELALDTGKARLEAMLVEAAQRRFDPDALPVGETEPQVSVGEAIHIVKLKRSEPGRGPGNGGGRQPYVATPEEAEQALIKQLKHFATRVEKDDLANGWTMHRGRMIPPGWVRPEDARCSKCGGELEPSPPHTSSLIQ